jgi:hypothetical protein
MASSQADPAGSAFGAVCSTVSGTIHDIGAFRHTVAGSTPAWPNSVSHPMAPLLRENRRRVACFRRAA